MGSAPRDGEDWVAVVEREMALSLLGVRLV